MLLTQRKGEFDNLLGHGESLILDNDSHILVKLCFIAYSTGCFLT